MNTPQKIQLVKDIKKERRLPVNRQERRVLDQHFVREERRERRAEARVVKTAYLATLKARAEEATAAQAMRATRSLSDFVQSSRAAAAAMDRFAEATRRLKDMTIGARGEVFA